MRAVRVIGPGDIEVADIPEPAHDAGYRIAVEQVGICGTDVKVVDGSVATEYPRILGHEMVGRVLASPPGGYHTEGSRVMVNPAVSCDSCDLCLAGRTNLCRNGGLMGRDVDGVFADVIVAPESSIVAVPDQVSKEASGLLQVLGTCVHATKTVNAFPGKTAAVIGLGVAGQLIAQLLVLQGISVVGITRSEWKRDLALRLGASRVAAPEDAADVLREVTSDSGPDIVVEAVGTERTLSEAIELVGVGGEIVVFGTVTRGGSGLPYYQLYHKELTLHNRHPPGGVGRCGTRL